MVFNFGICAGPETVRLFKPHSMTKYYTPTTNAMQTFYLTFPFGARREIGVDLLHLGTRWIEIKARSRARAREIAAAKFGHEGWQLYDIGNKLFIYLFYRINECKFDETTTAMKNNLPPVACQLTHPDAFFYDIQVSENLIYGFFEAHEKGQSFHVATKVFLNCACELGYIADYDESVQRVYISDNFEGTDHPALAWVCDLIEANRDATQAILKAAVEFEFDQEITRLAREAASGLASSSVAKRIYRNVDSDFCDAILKIAGIIEAVEAYQEEVEAANE